jgi:hypothetical protein
VIKEKYKGHIIYATAWQLVGESQWEPRVWVNWEEGSEAIFKVASLTKSYGVREEAERQGIVFVKSWIDDGKPPILAESRVIQNSRSPLNDPIITSPTK